MLSWWQGARLLVPRSGIRGLASLMLLVFWSLWKECNRRIFLTVSAFKRASELRTAEVFDEGNVWTAAGFAAMSDLLAKHALPTHSTKLVEFLQAVEVN
jgi:hypothetical protein